MIRTRIVIVVLAVALMAAAIAASSQAQVLGSSGKLAGTSKSSPAKVAKPKKDEWCRDESCPANPPATFKVNEKKKTWVLKSSGVVGEHHEKFKETFRGTFTISAGTYTFTETEGEINGNPEHPEVMFTGVKTATGFNSPSEPGTYTIGADPGFEEGWWTENN